MDRSVRATRRARARSVRATQNAVRPTEPVCSAEPCPAGDGELVVMSNGARDAEVPVPEPFFQGALLYGKARVEPEVAVIMESGKDPRSFTGRTLALFTEMRLKNGAKVPICGVLYQGYF